MIDLVKKTLLTGVGLAALTKDKAEELAKELANQMQLTGDKGKVFVDDVVAKSEKARKNLEDTVQRYVSDALKKMNIPTQDEIARLTDRIEQLERTIAEKLP